MLSNAIQLPNKAWRQVWTFTLGTTFCLLSSCCPANPSMANAKRSSWLEIRELSERAIWKQAIAMNQVKSALQVGETVKAFKITSTKRSVIAMRLFVLHFHYPIGPIISHISWAPFAFTLLCFHRSQFIIDQWEILSGGNRRRREVETFFWPFWDLITFIIVELNHFLLETLLINAVER